MNQLPYIKAHNHPIKKTTKTITFLLQQEKRRFSGKITIYRTIFGVQYNSKSFFEDLGDQAIKNEFDLNFVLMHQ